MVAATGGSATEAMNVSYGVTGKHAYALDQVQRHSQIDVGVKGLVQQPFIFFLAVFASLGGMLFG